MTSRPATLPKAAQRSSSRGSVTAETAAVLPALMVVLAAALWAIQAVTAQLQCVDAARAAVRAAARGEPSDEVRDLVRAATGQEAHVTISRDPEQTEIEISVDVRPPWGPVLPAVRVTASATAATEPLLPTADPRPIPHRIDESRPPVRPPPHSHNGRRPVEKPMRTSPLTELYITSEPALCTSRLSWIAPCP